MSRTVEMLIAAGSLPAAAGGLGALALGVGGVAYGVYAILKQLQQDYQDGLQEFRQKAACDEQDRQHLAGREHDKTDEGLDLVARTRVTSTTDVNAEFLRHRVEQLQERHSENTELAEHCAKLLKKIVQAPDQFNTHLEAYRKLADAAGKRKTADTLQDEIAALREEIQSSLLDDPEVAETRAQLLAQLDNLQTVAVRQRTVAGQGLSVLRQRVYREIQAQAECQQIQTRMAEERRYLVSEIFAKTRAIQQVPDAPELTEGAQALTTRLNQALARDAELTEIQALAQQAGELFAACENALSMHVMSAYMHEEMTDVLQSLGYRVTDISGEADDYRFVTAVDEVHGIEFHVDGLGLKSEMVALTPNAIDATPEDQEKVCHVMDQVVLQMRKRHGNIRERHRTSIKSGEQLRVVEMPAEEAAPSAAAPREMTIDESERR
ncbi:MAG: hypothetical protein ACYDCO_17305 [Armatimonadota bacterium]